MKNTFRLTIDITNYCNFDCKYCTLSIPYKQALIHKNLSIKDTKIIVMYANKYLTGYNIDCSIRGGEPTLHNEFDKIVDELRRIKSLNNLILLTNGSIPLRNYNVDYSIFSELRISIHADTIQRKPHYLDIILNNIEFLLSRKIIPVIHIMKSTETLLHELDSLLATVISLFNKYNVDTRDVEITDTFSTENYTNTKYDYSKVDSIYNQRYKEPVYYRRAIKITPDMTCHYSCDLVANIKWTSNNIYYPYTWNYILQHINETTICEFYQCTCPIFCFKK